MENAHSNASATQRQQQQQHKFQSHQDQQQQQHEYQQQFCLRWHNHQTSLLSTLPVLLDQSHLTDVTISAEGRTLRAHRVVLSACSTFFLELFRALDATNHPVIILPGASFAAIVALLTFMYSGEVNVYEEQIPMLLNLAETLGVKGLADVQNNKSTPKCRSTESACEQTRKAKDDAFDAQTNSLASRVRSPSPPPAPASAPPIATFSAPATQMPALSTTIHPFVNPLLASKIPPQLESLFLKSLQFYPHLLPQPLNFSQTALNKTTELLAKYQKQCNLYQGALSTLAVATGTGPKEILSTGAEALTSQHRLTALSSQNKTSLLTHEDPVAQKRFCPSDKTQSSNIYMQQSLQQQQQHDGHQQKDSKRIDKIADSLRYASCGSTFGTRQPTICETKSSKYLSTEPQHTLQPTLVTSSYTTTATNSSCSFSRTISPQLGATKPPPIFTPASVSAATAMRNQSPQQQQLPSSISTASATAFDVSVEEQVARSLHQQIEQLTNSNRPGGCSSGDGCANEASMMDSNNGNKQKATTVAVEKLHAAQKTASSVLTLSTSPGANAAQGKTPSNSKLYATCFICHKQLSNQYNLRVHLETHQNVRYSCNVCSHVSRSKDALRKHVSYRHPGAPSPCENEARRKRATKILLGNSGTAHTMSATPPPAAGVTNTIIGNTLDSGNSSASSNSSEAQIAAAAAHLNSAAAYMFLPNQFHLAAAAAAVAQHQHEQQHQQQQQQLQHLPSPQSMEGFSTPTADSPAGLDIDATLTTVSLPAATVPIKLEQHSPSSTEATSDPPTPQQEQQQKFKGNNSRETDRDGSIQNSSPV